MNKRFNENEFTRSDGKRYNDDELTIIIMTKDLLIMNSLGDQSVCVDCKIRECWILIIIIVA